MTRILVLGCAASGKAAAQLATQLGHEVTIYDRNPDSFSDAPNSWRQIGGDWNPALLSDVDRVVASPGIPPSAAPIVDSLALGVPLMSEMEFASRQLRCRYVAITGTNGKTTTTCAAASMLTNSGINAVAAGNIGRALSEVALEDRDVVVIEASSFQLQFVSSFHPTAAAVVNIASDHLDWHGGSASYTMAKRRIGEFQNSEDIVVFDFDDDGARAAVAGLPARKVPASGSLRPTGGNGPEGSVLCIDEMEFNHPKLDEAFTVDLVIAATVARSVGATRDGIEKSLDTFTPLIHRRTLIGRWNGVEWINDSKATNPHAAAATVAAYESVILIAGGRNKGLDLSLLPRLAATKAVVAIGEATSELRAATPARIFHPAGSVDEAVAIADRIAVAGDTVLLAPGCASFDMFDDYQHRGRVFTELVLRRKDL